MSVYTPSFGALGAATVVFEYQRASPTAKLRQFGTGPHARIVEHTLRRIDSAHRRRTTARDQNLSKGVVAAADVEPAKALRNSEPFEECFTDHAAPTAHAPFIGFAISEELFILAHVKYLDRLNSQARAYSKQNVAAKLTVVCCCRTAAFLCLLNSEAKFLGSRIQVETGKRPSTAGFLMAWALRASPTWQRKRGSERADDRGRCDLLRLAKLVGQPPLTLGIGGAQLLQASNGIRKRPRPMTYMYR